MIMGIFLGFSLLNTFTRVIPVQVMALSPSHIADHKETIISPLKFRGPQEISYKRFRDLPGIRGLLLPRFPKLSKLKLPPRFPGRFPGIFPKPSILTSFPKPKCLLKRPPAKKNIPDTMSCHVFNATHIRDTLPGPFYGNGFTWDEARELQCSVADYAVLASEEAVENIKAIVKGTRGYFTTSVTEGNSSYFIMWVGGAKNPSMKKDAWYWLTGEHIPQSAKAWLPGYPKESGDCLAFCAEEDNRDVSGFCNLPCTKRLNHQLCQARGTFQKMEDGKCTMPNAKPVVYRDRTSRWLG